MANILLINPLWSPTNKNILLFPLVIQLSKSVKEISPNTNIFPIKEGYYYSALLEKSIKKVGFDAVCIIIFKEQFVRDCRDRKMPLGLIRFLRCKE